MTGTQNKVKVVEAVIVNGEITKLVVEHDDHRVVKTDVAIPAPVGERPSPIYTWTSDDLSDSDSWWGEGLLTTIKWTPEISGIATIVAPIPSGDLSNFEVDLWRGQTPNVDYPDATAASGDFNGGYLQGLYRGMYDFYVEEGQAYIFTIMNYGGSESIGETVDLSEFLSSIAVFDLNVDLPSFTKLPELVLNAEGKGVVVPRSRIRNILPTLDIVVDYGGGALATFPINLGQSEDLSPTSDFVFPPVTLSAGQGIAVGFMPRNQFNFDADLLVLSQTVKVMKLDGTQHILVNTEAGWWAPDHKPAKLPLVGGNEPEERINYAGSGPLSDTFIGPWFISYGAVYLPFNPASIQEHEGTDLTVEDWADREGGYLSPPPVTNGHIVTAAGGTFIVSSRIFVVWNSRH